MSADGVLVYDGDCGFCERSIARIRAVSGTTARAVPSDAVDLAAMGLTEEACAAAVQWVGRTATTAGAEALRDFAAAGARWSAVLAHVIVNPVTRPLTRRAYDVVARNRHRFGSPSCGVPGGAPRPSG